MDRTTLPGRQMWPYGSLVTEIIVDGDPVAHYVATEEVDHGHQITTNPRAACDRIVPNTMASVTLREDDRCVDCLIAMPDAEPYPAPPAIVTYACPVCSEANPLDTIVRDGENSWLCTSCATRWPDGLAERGVLSYPGHVDPETGMPLPPVDETAATQFFEPVKVGRDLDADTGEMPHAIGAFLLSDRMRVLCQHNHPASWVRIAERLPDVERDGAAFVVLRLLCGRVDDTHPTGGQVAVLVDPEFDDESVDA